MQNIAKIVMAKTTPFRNIMFCYQVTVYDKNAVNLDKYPHNTLTCWLSVWWWLTVLRVLVGLLLVAWLSVGLACGSILWGTWIKRGNIWIIIKYSQTENLRTYNQECELSETFNTG